MSASSSVYFAQTPSPLGRIILAVSDAALCGLYFDDQADCPVAVYERTVNEHACPWLDPLCPLSAQDIFIRVITQLAEWFSGKRTGFDIPLCLQGTPFQCRVWQELQTIPFGHTLTYGEVSIRVSGNARGSRAVGAAVGKNPVSIIVPCHRVVGAHGQLTGFSGGIHRKSSLLAHEGRSLV